ncbi:MAG TPA: hypothetical protein PLO78_03580 [Candidatus Omnitrophota bacterium]|nr:hypothetical protein [Candidatus Omnitrophota bacterium]
MNIKKTVLTMLQYLFFVLFVAVLLITLSGAKMLSQEVLKNEWYRELIRP